MKNLNSLTGVIGLINNDAVARIRSGKFEDGIKLYKNALESLTEDLNIYSKEKYKTILVFKLWSSWLWNGNQIQLPTSSVVGG